MRTDQATDTGRLQLCNDQLLTHTRYRRCPIINKRWLRPWAKVRRCPSCDY